MGLECPPREKAHLFNHVSLHGNYVGVLRPIKTEESELEIPETADSNESMENTTTRVAAIGSEVEMDISTGDEVLVSRYMQEPHQIVKEEDEEGTEWFMFILDSNMVVGTMDNQRDKVENALDGGSV